MQKEGYSCIGAMMKLHERGDLPEVCQTAGEGDLRGEGNDRSTAALPGEGGDSPGADGKTCCTAEDAHDAAEVARKLGMPFYVFRFTEEFRCQVMDRFVNSYLAGETPNPCIDCNRYMKFEKLYERAKLLGCEKIVTGHYARISRDEKSGRWQMRMALDRTKDQSYVLYRLTEEQLSHVSFPLGEFTKEQVRRLAQEYGFYNADKQDSQDICFVPDGNYEKFIEEYAGRTVPEGNFVTQDGEILGRHKGIICYTVGQRRGLGISAAFPWYVKEIRPDSNEVVLCAHEDLFQKTLFAGEVNWVSIPEPEGKIRVQAKIRYRHTPQPASAEMTKEGLLKVIFDEPQRAITRGQSVVLYDGDLVLGGGKICKAE